MVLPVRTVAVTGVSAGRVDAGVLGEPEHPVDVVQGRPSVVVGA